MFCLKEHLLEMFLSASLKKERSDDPGVRNDCLVGKTQEV